MTTEVIERTEDKVVAEPKFRDPSTLTAEQLTDPDYRLKQVMKENGGRSLTCSKCHHCR